MTICNFCGTEFNDDGYCPVCGSAHGICPMDGACQSRIDEGCDGCWVLSDEHLAKIRRRVEDRLRKSGREAIIKVASELGIKLI